MVSGGQQYCLKWNNHTNNMVKVFNQLLDDQDFCDVTLAVDGTHLKAHKLVLSACSSYFRDLFIANPCKHPIVILKDMRFDDLKAIINFMYSGEVNVSQSQLGALLKTAEVLKVKGLTEVNDKQTTETTTSVSTSSPTKPSTETQQTPSVTSGCVTRKKRRRKANPNTNSGSGDESGPNSSQSEDSCDEASNKKPKENTSTTDSLTLRTSKDSRSLLSEANVTKTKTDSQNSNVIQTRRRQTLQHLETETTAEIAIETPIDCDQRINNGNQSESWASSADHSTALVLTTNETEDDSDDMFDVKPIVSFNESPTQASNALTLHEESSDMISNPNDSDAIPGPSSLQSGNIRTSLRSFGYQPIFTDSRSECPFCHKKIVNMRRHVNEVHIGLLYQCQICCRKFKRKDKLNHHLITEHNI